MIIENCEACSLCKTRTNIVNGKGDNSADFMLIGEAPGKEEDEQGIPFVGASGGLINIALERINVIRDDIYISNIIKCRPPNNRDPKNLEIEMCLSYLMYEIIEVNPKVICLLGRVAAKIFIPTLRSITKEEGDVYIILNGIKAVPICHPSYYLRNYAPKEDFFYCIKEAYKLSLA
jgi:DNA polymerase